MPKKYSKAPTTCLKKSQNPDKTHADSIIRHGDLLENGLRTTYVWMLFLKNFL